MHKILYIGIYCLLLSACHSIAPQPPVDAYHKPLQSFHGQLSIIESAHRWQVLIQWQADLISGKVRLTHAVTGSIVELQWQGESIQIRSNKNHDQQWHAISAEALMKYGIVLPPQTIAQILHHKIPTSLQSQGNNIWQGQLHHNTIRLRWQNNHSKLTMTDISHGRTAILRILP